MSIVIKNQRHIDRYTQTQSKQKGRLRRQHEQKTWGGKERVQPIPYKTSLIWMIPAISRNQKDKQETAAVLSMNIQGCNVLCFDNGVKQWFVNRKCAPFTLSTASQESWPGKDYGEHGVVGWVWNRSAKITESMVWWDQYGMGQQAGLGTRPFLFGRCLLGMSSGRWRWWSVQAGMQCLALLKAAERSRKAPVSEWQESEETGKDNRGEEKGKDRWRQQQTQRERESERRRQGEREKRKTNKIRQWRREGGKGRQPKIKTDRQTERWTDGRVWVGGQAAMQF